MVWKKREAGSEQWKNIAEERNLSAKFTPVWSKTQGIWCLNSDDGKKEIEGKKVSLIFLRNQSNWVHQLQFSKTELINIINIIIKNYRANKAWEVTQQF